MSWKTFKLQPSSKPRKERSQSTTVLEGGSIQMTGKMGVCLRSMSLCWIPVRDLRRREPLQSQRPTALMGAP